jgi:predicted transcriptional regulator YheO
LHILIFYFLLKNLFNLRTILFQNEHILKKIDIFMVNLILDEFTYRRISALLSDLMDKRKRNMDYNDLVNELIDNYQQNNWDHDVLSGG